MNCDCGHHWDRHGIYGCGYYYGEHEVPMPIPGCPDFIDYTHDSTAERCQCFIAFGGSPIRIAEWILIGATE